MPSLASHFQKRLLNSSRIEDYIFTFVIPLIPVIFSLMIGIWEPTNEKYQSTGYQNATNQMSLIATLPLSLFFLRQLGDYLFGINVEINPPDKVPLVTLFQNKDIQAEIHKRLKKIALNPRITYVVLLLDLIFHFFDIGGVLKQYLLAFLKQKITYTDHEIYWANLFLIKKDLDIQTNFLFIVFVYFGQFIILFIALTANYLVLRYNLFYLNLIYQRSRVLEENIRYYIVLNLDDPNRRFGLKKLNFIFNLEIFLLFVAGMFALASRLQSTREFRLSRTEQFRFPELFSEENLGFFLYSLFPNFGQYMIVILWLFAFFGFFVTLGEGKDKKTEGETIV